MTFFPKTGAILLGCVAVWVRPISRKALCGASADAITNLLGNMSMVIRADSHLFPVSTR